MKTASDDRSVPLRVIVLNPPGGVAFGMQRGRSELLSPSRRQPSEIVFDLTLRLGKPLSGGRPNFLGKFAHGSPSDRFLYVNSGARAGQRGSCWDRRAEFKLASIESAQIRRLLSDPRLVLEARVQGTGRDGGPACATVPLLDGWRLVEAETAYR
jgi:Family of unknown function (DUF5990)